MEKIIVIIVGFVIFAFITPAITYLLRSLLRLPQRRNTFRTPLPGDYLFGDPDKPRERNPRRHRGLRI